MVGAKISLSQAYVIGLKFSLEMKVQAHEKVKGNKSDSPKSERRLELYCQTLVVRNYFKFVN